MFINQKLEVDRLHYPRKSSVATLMRGALVLSVWIASAFGAETDPSLPDGNLPHDGWLIRIETESHKPTGRRTEVRSSGQLRVSKISVAKVEQLFAGEMANGDLQKALEATRTLMRNFSVTNVARTNSKLDSDLAHVVFLSTSNRVMSVWFGNNELVVDKTLIDDVRSLHEVINRSLPSEVRLSVPANSNIPTGQ